jgi:hypothetical protein
VKEDGTSFQHKVSLLEDAHVLEISDPKIPHLDLPNQALVIQLYSIEQLCEEIVVVQQKSVCQPFQLPRQGLYTQEEEEGCRRNEQQCC